LKCLKEKLKVRRKTMNQVETVEVVENSVTTVTQQATSLQVIDNVSYQVAGELLKAIKGTIKQVEGYWAEPKKSAYEAHQSIIKKEKQMTESLKESESKLKSGMSDYLRIKEDERKKLEQQALENYGVEVVLKTNTPTVEGISAITDYEITVEDISKVPTIFNGVQIVEIDTGAIKRLAKLMKGKIIIPGIKISETKTIRSNSK
jgi:hypothetical protein